MKKLILFAAVLSLTACTKLTQENYDALKMGMSQEEINKILGSPDNCTETLGTDSCIWGSEDGAHIKISFIADNAATFTSKGLK
jgi:peroxiredoxin